MKHFHVLAIAFMMITAIIMSSCEIVKTETEENTSTIHTGNLLYAFTSIKIDAETATEVLKEINKSLDKGLDENLYLRELWMDEPDVKVASSCGAPLLKTKLEKYFKQYFSTKSSMIQDMFMGTDWVIYWPYSDQWDGTTLPVITTVPEDKEQEWNYGYKIITDENGNEKLEQVYVDDDYAYNHPVWVVKQEEELPYDILPNFNKGEISYNGTTFLPVATKSVPDTAHIWKMTKAIVTKQYDSIFFGSSNFKITISFPPYNGNVATTAEFYTNFTRSEIRNQIAKTLNFMLNSDWNTKEISNGMTIVETDGGIEINLHIELESDDDTCIPYLGPQSFDILIPINDDDDIVMNYPYKRVYVRSTAGRSLQIMDNGGFNFFMRMDDVV